MRNHNKNYMDNLRNFEDLRIIWHQADMSQARFYQIPSNLAPHHIYASLVQHFSNFYRVPSGLDPWNKAFIRILLAIRVEAMRNLVTKGMKIIVFKSTAFWGQFIGIYQLLSFVWQGYNRKTDPWLQYLLLHTMNSPEARHNCNNKKTHANPQNWVRIDTSSRYFEKKIKNFQSWYLNDW